MSDNKEGFWYSERQPNLPKPEAQDKPWLGQNLFLAKLGEAESKAKVTRYRRFSPCRLCNKVNGCGEYSLNDWTWPEGLKHYIKEHNVKPSEEFIDFILESYKSW